MHVLFDGRSGSLFQPHSFALENSLDRRRQSSEVLTADPSNRKEKQGDIVCPQSFYDNSRVGRVFTPCWLIAYSAQL